MLSFPTALPPQDFYKGKQNQNSSAAFSEKPLEWEKKDEGVCGFLHIKTYSIYFSLPSPYLSLSLSGCLQQQESRPQVK